MKSYLVAFVWLYGLVVHQATAQRRPDNDPVLTFKAFWQSYQDKYPTFDMKQVDWQQQYIRYAPLVDSTTSPERLFTVLSEMIRPLHDAHVRLAIRNVKPPKVFWPRKPSVYSNQFQFNKDSVQTYWQATDATLAKQGFEPLRAIGGTNEDSTREFYYARSGDYGYVRISSCTYGKRGSGPKLRELDSILAYFGSVRGVLLDIRFNQGGGDRFAFGVAGRFVDKGRVGCYRYRRRKRGGYTDFVKLTTFRLRPKGKHQFPKLPIALLTNDRTVSAGDILALIMHPLPNVRLVGENTEGSFDSFRFMQLPNGWFYSVPQKRFHDAQNKCYEGSGVPVDVKVIVGKDDLRASHDPVIRQALADLTNRQP
ncbi:hypothetical protein DYU11_15745 [Fibrisoma montanum]|uniref:Tail specific protease domain-containing protein n=1 Tax=Fibrisoma montanum TaxID=2305895 RepID=A0A418M8Q4_9BACT|nr:S41 family peptidase [Fibrisoma montanum]RIV22468.1 hypothetical protein DYU11_15745 [Fibrisoma montanum]